MDANDPMVGISSDGFVDAVRALVERYTVQTFMKDVINELQHVSVTVKPNLLG
jgi:hypothetical protein